MPKLLIDEHPLLVLPSLAAAIGLPESIFLQQLHYWLETSGHIQDDGRKWYFNTYENWSQQFPWWNIGTVRRLVNNLRAAGLILTTTRYNRMAIDNTLWYAIDYTRLDQLTTPPSPPPDTDPPHPPEPDPPDEPDPPIPADPPEPTPTSAENDTSSADSDRPRAQNAQTTRAKCTDHARKMRAPITRDLLSKTSSKTSLVVGVHIHSKPHRISSKKRAHARTRDPQPPTPLPTYAAANTHPAAIDAALLSAGILDPGTRAGILEAQPGISVETILGWDAHRSKENQAHPNRQMGAGALVALLRTGQRPPSTPDATRWLTRNGYLAAEPQPSGSRPGSAAPPSILSISSIQPDPAALALWQPVISQLSLSHRAAYDNWLRHTTPTAYDPDTGRLTIAVATPFALDWLENRMKGMLRQRLQQIAQRSIDLNFQLPDASP